MVIASTRLTVRTEGYDKIAIHFDDDEQFDGDFVMQQGDDTIVVRQDDAIAFAQALLDFVNGKSDG